MFAGGAERVPASLPVPASADFDIVAAKNDVQPKRKDKGREENATKLKKVKQVRQEFPESWIWADTQIRCTHK